MGAPCLQTHRDPAEARDHDPCRGLAGRTLPAERHVRRRLVRPGGVKSGNVDRRTRRLALGKQRVDEQMTGAVHCREPRTVRAVCHADRTIDGRHVRRRHPDELRMRGAHVCHVVVPIASRGQHAGGAGVSPQDATRRAWAAPERVPGDAVISRVEGAAVKQAHRDLSRGAARRQQPGSPHVAEAVRAIVTPHRDRRPRPAPIQRAVEIADVVAGDIEHAGRPVRDDRPTSAEDRRSGEGEARACQHHVAHLGMPDFHAGRDARPEPGGAG